MVKGKNQWNTLADLLTGLESKLKLTYPSNIVAYLSNFEGLGIIQIRRDIYVIEEGVYEKLEAIYGSNYEKIKFDKEVKELKFKKGQIKITPFGELFIKACLFKL